MSRIFITGSSDGLGLMAAQELARRGHKITLHARNDSRAADAKAACPQAENVLVGDLSSISATRQLAADANAFATFDCVIHNAGIYLGPFRRTHDELPAVIAINVVAPYLLTCLMHRPQRLVFLSSDSHYGGDASLHDLTWKERGEARFSASAAYSDSKLCNNLLANAFARIWPNVTSNSLDPGWMATKMGGRMASTDFESSIATYVMLAEGEGAGKGSGKFFEPHRREAQPHRGANDEAAQDRLLAICKGITGVGIPG